MGSSPPAHRLVQHDERRVAHQRLSDAEPLLHALRVLADLAVGRRREADQLEELAAAPLAVALRHPGEPREEPERLAPGEEVVPGRVLREVADAALRGAARDRRVEDEGLAAGRVDEAHQHLDGGRLAGAVRADEPEDLALLHRQCHVVDRRHAAPPHDADVERLREPLGAQDHRAA